MGKGLSLDPAQVFVYGSLKEGFGNHGRLYGSPKMGDAKTKPGFKLLDLGAFPGMVVQEGYPGTVKGEVYDLSANPVVVFESLDRLESEGFFYKRIVIPVVLEAREIEVQTYVLLDPADYRQCPVIEDGVWDDERGW